LLTAQSFQSHQKLVRSVLVLLAKNLAAAAQPSNFGAVQSLAQTDTKQFPVWSGREGRGSRGWFIYPTLRAVQPDIVKKWEQGFSKIVKEYD
jgi:hypothetical protein